LSLTADFIVIPLDVVMFQLQSLLTSLYFVFCIMCLFYFSLVSFFYFTRLSCILLSILNEMKWMKCFLSAVGCFQADGHDAPEIHDGGLCSVQYFDARAVLLRSSTAVCTTERHPVDWSGACRTSCTCLSVLLMFVGFKHTNLSQPRCK